MHVDHRVGREQRLSNQCAVGANHHNIRGRRGHAFPRLGIVHVLGLGYLDPEAARGLDHRGALQPPASATLAIGTTEHDSWPVP